MGNPVGSIREDLTHLGRGVLMGVADVIPGVSGGTLALILGIYNRLVTALSHFDRHTLQLVLRGDCRDAFTRVDLRFLVVLASGIACGILALGGLMHWLLEHERQHTLSAFFGMIAASSLLVGRMISRFTARELVLLVAGVVGASFIVSLPALAHPPDALWYIFVCGVVGICAMILPGISGAFVLLLMGKYHDLTGILKNAVTLQVTTGDVAVVAVLGTGCVLGLITFSKCLRWLLARHEPQTMAALCGFMIGSLWKIWPFQADLTPSQPELKLKEFAHLPLSEIPLDRTSLMTIAIGVGAGLVVLGLDYATKTSAHVPPLPEPEIGS
jgi:putative membrane protein